MFLFIPLKEEPPAAIFLDFSDELMQSRPYVLDCCKKHLFFQLQLYFLINLDPLSSI